jgi:hypothetical protein
VKGDYAGFVYGAFSIVYSERGAEQLSRLGPLLKQTLTPADEFINALTGTHPRKDMIRDHIAMLAPPCSVRSAWTTLVENSRVQLMARRLASGPVGDMSLFLKAYHSPRNRLDHRTDSGQSDVEENTAIVNGQRVPTRS